MARSDRSPIFADSMRYIDSRSRGREKTIVAVVTVTVAIFLVVVIAIPLSSEPSSVPMLKSVVLKSTGDDGGGGGGDDDGVDEGAGRKFLSAAFYAVPNKMQKKKDEDKKSKNEFFWPPYIHGKKENGGDGDDDDGDDGDDDDDDSYWSKRWERYMKRRKSHKNDTKIETERKDTESESRKTPWGSDNDTRRWPWNRSDGRNDKNNDDDDDDDDKNNDDDDDDNDESDCKNEEECIDDEEGGEDERVNLGSVKDDKEDDKDDDKDDEDDDKDGEDDDKKDKCKGNNLEYKTWLRCYYKGQYAERKNNEKSTHHISPSYHHAGKSRSGRKNRGWRDDDDGEGDEGRKNWRFTTKRPHHHMTTVFPPSLCPTMPLKRKSDITLDCYSNQLLHEVARIQSKGIPLPGPQPYIRCYNIYVKVEKSGGEYMPEGAVLFNNWECAGDKNLWNNVSMVATTSVADWVEKFDNYNMSSDIQLSFISQSEDFVLAFECYTNVTDPDLAYNLRLFSKNRVHPYNAQAKRMMKEAEEAGLNPGGFEVVEVVQERCDFKFTNWPK